MVDLWVGILNDIFKLEVFVINLFNNFIYLGGNVVVDFGGNLIGMYSGFYGVYVELCMFGGWISVKF